MPEGASGYCECGDGAHVAEMNCDHGSFSCVDECKGIVYKQDEVLLTEYDMGRRDQRRAVDKIQRCVRVLYCTGKAGGARTKSGTGCGWS